jgi:hypothetical protein
MFDAIHDRLADHLHSYSCHRRHAELFRRAGSRTREVVASRCVHRTGQDFDGVPLAVFVSDGDGAWAFGHGGQDIKVRQK